MVQISSNKIPAVPAKHQIKTPKFSKFRNLRFPPKIWYLSLQTKCKMGKILILILPLRMCKKLRLFTGCLPIHNASTSFTVMKYSAWLTGKFMKNLMWNMPLYARLHVITIDNEELQQTNYKTLVSIKFISTSKIYLSF